MLLERRVYYKYPDKMLVSCKGVAPNSNNYWKFTPPNGNGVKCSAGTLNDIRDKLTEQGFELPEDFGTVTKLPFKGIYISKLHVKIRPVVPYKRHSEWVSFQFDCTRITSFTQAINNAVRCKKIINNLGKEIDSMRKKINE